MTPDGPGHELNYQYNVMAIATTSTSTSLHVVVVRYNVITIICHDIMAL